MRSLLVFFSFSICDHGQKATLSRASAIDDFTDQGLLVKPEEEVCSFKDNDVSQLLSRMLFPSFAVVRAFSPVLKPDSISSSWICFPEYPFLIVPLFDAVFPADSNSEAKIKEFLSRFLLQKRTFCVPDRITTLEEDSEFRGSSTTKMSTCSTKFGLSDMDDLVKVKKETKPAIPNKEPGSKATTVCKKRKTDVEVIDIEIFDKMGQLLSKPRWIT
ncbi:hypothetical protein L1887_09150 [Cichorium endivia]|nr:hypothetical protein L1887_09150 [Cichorium endivia]